MGVRVCALLDTWGMDCHADSASIVYMDLLVKLLCADTDAHTLGLLTSPEALASELVVAMEFLSHTPDAGWAGREAAPPAASAGGASGLPHDDGWEEGGLAVSCGGSSGGQQDGERAGPASSVGEPAEPTLEQRHVQRGRRQRGSGGGTLSPGLGQRGAAVGCLTRASGFDEGAVPYRRRRTGSCSEPGCAGPSATALHRRGTGSTCASDLSEQHSAVGFCSRSTHDLETDGKRGTGGKGRNPEVGGPRANTGAALAGAEGACPWAGEPCVAGAAGLPPNRHAGETRRSSGVGSSDGLQQRCETGSSCAGGSGDGARGNAVHVVWVHGSVFRDKQARVIQTLRQEVGLVIHGYKTVKQAAGARRGKQADVVVCSPEEADAAAGLGCVQVTLGKGPGEVAAVATVLRGRVVCC